ncbi:NAD-dependent epimerase/dehydratase family protein [Streptomyces sp. NRRL B-24484]|uniref:NAD-dependent epimerase/dehydratase family protein n=1 Tax=Streptomyces sp. NRRL B-24484 TaxID=1463833 RepID=UPI0004C139C4|nr:NAD-dependent epimerase/dehydratase family protein [Streptomyces sp. NRRL B-24484]
MSKHLIVGAGPVGTAAARLLAERGEEVTVVTRSGRTAEPLTGVRHLRLDAADADALGAAAAGAAVLYNCANPAYHRWATDWPPLAASLLRAAESSGAVLATVGNLYGYGAVDGPMTEDTPLAPNSVKGGVRARMWQDAEALHRAGRIRATEVRGSDYVGPGAESVLGERVVPRVLAGRGVQVLGDPDTAHSWTYTRDAARLLVAVGSDERAWGRPWHVPSNPPRSQREAVADLARAAGLPPVPVSRIPGPVLALLGLVNPTVRALRETSYQMERPFVMDSTAAERTFGLAPTPWPEVLTAVVEAHRGSRPA